MNTVHLIDCMEFMAGLPDNAYDLAIVDPPYGIGNWTMGERDKRPYNKKWDVKWNESPPDKIYFEELHRISKNQIIWGVNYYREYVPSGGAIIWDKGNRSHIGSGGEIASCSLITMVDYFFYQHTGYITKEKNRIHPCQKPVALYKWILKNYAKPGQTIFDSHVGSGSSRIACHDLGFDFEGCEIDEDYWSAQEQRYKTHIAQADLFETGEIQKLVYEK